MNNTGVTSPNLGYFYLSLIFLPASLYMLKELIILCKELSAARNEPVYETFIEDGEFKVSNPVAKKAAKQKQIFQTDKVIMENSRKGLINLGFGRKEAREIVQNLCKENCYLDEADLISDCL